MPPGGKEVKARNQKESRCTKRGQRVIRGGKQVRSRVKNSVGWEVGLKKSEGRLKEATT